MGDSMPRCEKLVFWSQERKNAHYVLLCLPSTLEDPLFNQLHQSLRRTLISHYENKGFILIDSLDIGIVDKIITSNSFEEDEIHGSQT